MKNKLFRRQLLLCIAIMSFFCLVLLILYHFSQRENTLLKTADESRFLTLAAGEAEAAVAAWEAGAPVPVVYHRLNAAADYLAMGPHSAGCEEIAAGLRAAGEALLRGEEAPADTEALLTGLQEALPAVFRRDVGGTAAEPVSAAGMTRAGMTRADMTRAGMTRAEGVSAAFRRSQADKITGTNGLLHPTTGDGLVFACDNVYVRLSPAGIPLEMAVYPPLRYAAGRDTASCRQSSGRILETVLPGFQARPGGTEPVWELAAEEEVRLRYLWREQWVETTVRRDTGRLVGLRITPGTVGEMTE